MSVPFAIRGNPLRPVQVLALVIDSVLSVQNAPGLRLPEGSRLTLIPGLPTVSGISPVSQLSLTSRPLAFLRFRRYFSLSGSVQVPAKPPLLILLEPEFRPFQPTYPGSLK